MASPITGESERRVPESEAWSVILIYPRLNNLETKKEKKKRKEKRRSLTGLGY